MAHSSVDELALFISGADLMKQFEPKFTDKN
jgi:hypothetical protein